MGEAYRAAQPFMALWLLMPLTLAPTAAALWLGAEPRAGLGSAILLATGLGLLALFGRLTVQVRDDTLVWQFGWLGLPRWRLPLQRIVRCELGHGSAWGAGIKGTPQRREYTAALNSPGVRFHLADGRSIFIGSAEPDRLRAVVEARLPAAGTHRR